MTEAIFATRPPGELAARTAALRNRLPGDRMPSGLRELARQIIQAVFGDITAEPLAGTP
jgi:hypothetical protein